MKKKAKWNVQSYKSQRSKNGIISSGYTTIPSTSPKSNLTLENARARILTENSVESPVQPALLYFGQLHISSSLILQNKQFWKEHYFELRNQSSPRLSYFKSTPNTSHHLQSEINGITLTPFCSVSTVVESKGCIFKICSRDGIGGICKVLMTLRAESSRESKGWQEAISKAIKTLFMKPESKPQVHLPPPPTQQYLRQQAKKIGHWISETNTSCQEDSKMSENNVKITTGEKFENNLSITIQEKLKSHFRDFDKDKNGIISLSELSIGLSECGLEHSIDDLKHIFCTLNYKDSVRFNGNSVTYSQFLDAALKGLL